MNQQQVPNVPVTDVPEEPAVPALLLDVREDDEWAAGHAPNALHIPMGELAGRLGELPDDAEVYVVCRSGGRSAQVTAYLNHNGWNARNVDGGMQAWVLAGRQLLATQPGAQPQVI